MSMDGGVSSCSMVACCVGWLLLLVDGIVVLGLIGPCEMGILWGLNVSASILFDGRLSIRFVVLGGFG